MTDDNPIRGNERQRRNQIIKLEGFSECPWCKALPGQPHEPGCRIERCSVCGGLRFRCRQDNPSGREDSCPSHDRAFARWTGIIPGEAEAYYMSADTEEFVNKYKAMFFIKPKI